MNKGKTAIWTVLAIGLLAVLVAAAGAITSVASITGLGNIKIISDNDAGDYIEFSSDTAETRPNVRGIGGSMHLTSENNITVISSLNILEDKVTGRYINFELGGGTNDEILGSHDNEISLGTAAKKWKDVLSYLINGADICFANNICMTEYVNDDGQIDIAFVYGKPTPDQQISIGLHDTETYQEYINRHSNNDGVFDNSMGESEFNTRRASIINNGKIDLTFGREVRMTLREVKDTIERVDELEATLCNQGVTKYC